MRNFLLTLVVLTAAFPAFSESMKMVVDSKGNVVGRYVRTNTNSYTVNVQDSYDVPKTGNKVVTFYAEKGQGVVWNITSGAVNVRSIPSTAGKIVGKIIDEEGCVPETFNCLGKENGWYKIKINGKTGYVRQDLMEWDGMDTF